MAPTKTWMAWILIFLGLFPACPQRSKPQLKGVFLEASSPPEPGAKRQALLHLQETIAECLGGEKQKTPFPKAWDSYQNPYQLRVWYRGRELWKGHSPGGDWQKILPKTLKEACRALSRMGKKPKDPHKIQIQWTLANHFQRLNDKNFLQNWRTLRRTYGLWGILLQKNKADWLYPADFLLKNYKMKKAFESFCPRGENPRECVKNFSGKMDVFEVLDYLTLSESPYVLDLFRLFPIISIKAVNDSELKRRLGLMRDWYLHNMEASGKMTYLYRVAHDRKSKTHNNMIRQFMTTLALFRLADYLEDPILREAAEKNLQFNLNSYMKVEEDKKIAYILFRRKAKLGSAAFALMSLWESRKHPDREKLINYLVNFILQLQQPNGSFKTFYLPKGRNDNQNYYPGEALLALMTLYEGDPVKYRRFLSVVKKAFPYYRNFFRTKTNTAFVPWHTMALYRYYQVTKDPQVAKFLFEMNDLLIGIQNTPKTVKTPLPDTMGRFYDPKQRKYGPPHASSTAIYTEGLVDAYRLALQLKDPKRQEKYAYSIRWGLRSLFQLQFLPETVFFVPNPQAAVGALHTRVTNTNIRVDNTQHATMAFLNVLALPEGGQDILSEDKE